MAAYDNSIRALTMIIVLISDLLQYIHFYKFVGIHL